MRKDGCSSGGSSVILRLIHSSSLAEVFTTAWIKLLRIQIHRTQVPFPKSKPLPTSNSIPIPMKTRLNPFLSLLFLTSTAVHGANLYWDANGTGTGVGGTGNWSVAGWRNGSTTGAVSTWTDGNIPTFATTTGIVTLNQNVSAAGILFVVNNNEIRPSGTNTLTLTAGSIIEANNIGNEIGALLAGSFVVQPKTGNLTGATSIVFKANNTGITGVELAASDDNNNIIVDDPGAFGPNNTPLKLTKGVLNIGNFTTDMIASSTANGSGGNLSLNAWTTELAGGAIRSRVGQNIWNGPITLSANSALLNRPVAGIKLTVASNINLGANTLTLSPNSPSDGIVLNGNIQGSGGITQANSALTGVGSITAASTSTLSGINTYTGATQISAGRLNLTGSLTSNISMAAGTALQGEGSTTGSLTFAGNADYFLDPTTSGPTAHFKANSIDASAGIVTIKLTGPSPVVSDMVVLESTGGPITGLISNFAFTGRGSLAFSPDQTKLLFTYAPANLVWKGNQTNATFWDLSTQNWENSSSPDAFQALDLVTFNDSATSFAVAIQGTSMEPGATLFNNSTNDYTLSGGAIAGSGAFTKSGTGKLTITNDNTYSGLTTINAGVVQLGDGTGVTGNLGSNSVIVNDGSLETSFNAQKVLSYNIEGTGTLTQKGSGTLVLTGTNTYAGGTTIASDSTLQIGNGGATGSISGGVVNNGTLTFNRSDATAFSNTISGSGGITKSAGASVTLNGNNTFAGTTQISGNSIIVVASSTALGSTAGGTNVASGRLELINGITVTGETLTIAGSGGNFGGAIQAQANAAATWAGPLILGTDARIGAAPGGALTLSGVISDGAGTALNIGAGTGGTAEVVVSNSANTYTGATNIIRGTLRLGASNALPTSTILDVDTSNAAENAVFEMAGFNQTVAGLRRSNVPSGNTSGTGTAFVTNAAETFSTFTVDQSTSTTYAGRISGNLNLVQSGTGTLTLSGPQVDHLGNTTVNGALVVAAASQITLTPTANGTSNSISGSGSLTLNGKLILNLANAETTPGSTWSLINTGTLTEEYGTAFGVQSSLGDFSEIPVDSGTWSLEAGGNLWTFTESSGVLTVATASTPFGLWISSYFPGETNPAIIGPDADPDQDGVNNLAEFALAGIPNSGSNNGYQAVATEDTDADLAKELTLTIAVRKAAGSPTFAGSPLTASVDGVKYTIEGSLDLNFPNSPVSDASPTTGPGGLPADWEYRRFRLDASEGLAGKGFLRVKTEAVE